MTKRDDEVIEIDLIRLVMALWQKALAIILATIITGGLFFACSAFLITPKYEAGVLMYVNSSSISLGSAKLSISQAEISAAKSLIDTYTVILKARTTLNDVIEATGVSYSYEELIKMIEANSVNATEVFEISVKSTNPVEAMEIANSIATILPEKIASIVEGSSARIVDMAEVPSKQVSPDLMRNLMLGALLGLFLSCGIVAVMEIMDGKIHSEDDLQSLDIPVLAVIPDLLMNSPDNYGYGKSTAKGKV